MAGKLVSNIKKACSYFTNSITKKLILVFLMNSVIPLGISSFITYKNSIRVLQEEYIKSNSRLIQQGSQNIAGYLEQLNQLSLSPYKDSGFIYNLAPRENDFSALMYSEKFLKSLLFSREDLVYLYYYIPSSSVLYSFSKQLYAKHRHPEVETELWVGKTIGSEKGLYLEPTHRFVNYKNIGSPGTKLVFTVNRNIKDISTNEVKGVLSLNVDVRSLQEMCNNLLTGNETVALADSDGNIFYSTGQDGTLIKQLAQNEQVRQNPSGHFTAVINREKTIVIFGKTFNDLILLKAIPYEFLQETAKKSVEFNMVIVLLMFLLAVVLSILISFTVTLPIKHLARNMKRVGKGDFNIDILPHSNDEIGLLTDKFNEMAKEINSLINSEYKAKIARKNAQIRALQAQVNPHFLNNALQSIGTLAIRKDAPEIYSMAKAIASMLRYTLKSSDEFVPLQTEIENTNHYLYIQKIRFGDRLNVIMDVDSSILAYKVPRLILQPLVENSIKYGIDGNQQQETILISGRQENRYVILEVKDTGEGIEHEKLNGILDWLKTDDELLGDGEHMGIRNVYNRIRLMYNENAELTIESKPGGGTTVIIKLPIYYNKE